MDSSQSPSHNGINATTQESRGGVEKNTLSHSTVWDVCTRPKSVQHEGKKKEEQKLLQNKQTERPMTLQTH